MFLQVVSNEANKEMTQTRPPNKKPPIIIPVRLTQQATTVTVIALCPGWAAASASEVPCAGEEDDAELEETYSCARAAREDGGPETCFPCGAVEDAHEIWNGILKLTWVFKRCRSSPALRCPDHKFTFFL